MSTSVTGNTGHSLCVCLEKDRVARQVLALLTELGHQVIALDASSKLPRETLSEATVLLTRDGSFSGKFLRVITRDSKSTTRKSARTRIRADKFRLGDDTWALGSARLIFVRPPANPEGVYELKDLEDLKRSLINIFHQPKPKKSGPKPLPGQYKGRRPFIEDVIYKWA